MQSSPRNPSCKTVVQELHWGALPGCLLHPCPFPHHSPQHLVHRVPRAKSSTEPSCEAPVENPRAKLLCRCCTARPLVAHPPPSSRGLRHPSDSSCKAVVQSPHAGSPRKKSRAKPPCKGCPGLCEAPVARSPLSALPATSCHALGPKILVQNPFRNPRAKFLHTHALPPRAGSLCKSSCKRSPGVHTAACRTLAAFSPAATRDEAASPPAPPPRAKPSCKKQTLVQKTTHQGWRGDPGTWGRGGRRSAASPTW